MIRKEKVAPKIFDIEGFKEYPGRGLTGSVSKADFTIGFEDFLIDRGVFLQSTDALPAAAGMTIFIAVGSDVIARIPLEDAGLTFKQRCIQPLMSLGIRSVLVSSSSQEKIDSLGKRLGFELSNLFGGLDTQSLNSKIDSMDPGIVFLPENQNLIVNGDRHITATVFDELRESTLPAELVLFNKSPRSVSVIGDLSREMRWLALEKKMLLSLAAIAVVGSFIAGFLSPIVPLAMTLLSILYISLMPGRALKSISSLNE